MVGPTYHACYFTNFGTGDTPGNEQFGNLALFTLCPGEWVRVKLINNCSYSHPQVLAQGWLTRKPDQLLLPYVATIMNYFVVGLAFPYIATCTFLLVHLS